MNDLARRIADIVSQGGPIGLDRFWNIALFDRDAGYYTIGAPIGAAGDFTTAPEISQMFGELLGAWAVAAWRGLGRPSPFVLAEFGPGRGTMMADALRAGLRLDTGFARAVRVRLIETSDKLAAEQLNRLARFDLPAVRVRRFAEIEPLPLVLLANELFDAVAIRQFRFSDGTWRERRVGIAGEGEADFAFVEAAAVDASRLALPAEPPKQGAIFEASPLREAIAAEIGEALARRQGAALIVDYGHARSGYGDTLQALRAHAFADPLAEPGGRDITSHVDFERLSKALEGAGALVSPVVEQGAFLFSLGLLERAGALGRDADAAARDALRASVQRLAGGGPGDMGSLFKVLAASSVPLNLPPFTGMGA